MLKFEINDPIELLLNQKELIWKNFLRKGTTHTYGGKTFGYVLQRCYDEKIDFEISCVHGGGYFILPIKDERKKR